MSDILKTTSYHIDDDNGLMLSKRGSLWAISVDTTDGVIEVEMTAKAACAVREFFADATCDACKAAPEPQPAPELRAALDAKPCDDRTCTDRDHWAPIARINHGSTPTTCVHGQDHPDSLTCEYRCAATMPGHWCTRREHADDRHVWAMSDEEAERHLREEDWFADHTLAWWDEPLTFCDCDDATIEAENGATD